MAALAGGLGGLLGGSAALTQIFLYSLVQQLISASLAPYLTQAQIDVQSGNPLVPQAPPDLAEMVLKTILTEAEGEHEAAMSGENATRFARRVLNTGEPPALEQVLQWARRGILPFGDACPGVPSVPEAVRTSRIRSNWLDTILAAQYLPISAADAVNAWVRGQIPEAQALELLNYNGLKPDMATILYNTTGRPPAPGELATFVRRGLIPMHGTGPDALTFQQGIIEGDLKDKWEPVFENLVVNIPGVFEIRNMQLSGGISAAAAAKYYAMLGVPADLTAGLVTSGSGVKLATAKALTESQMLKLYSDQILSAAEVTPMLEALGHDQQEVAYLLDLQDLSRTLKAIQSAVSKVQSLFVAGKIPAAEVTQALGTLGIPAHSATSMLNDWQLERSANIRVLTEAQIVDALEYSVIDQGTAQSYLEGLGYSPYDAWVLISVKLKAPQPNQPTQGMNVSGASQ